jgi:hypothetical protein
MYICIVLSMSEKYKKSNLKNFITKIFFLTFYKKCATLFESGVVKNLEQFE